MKVKKWMMGGVVGGKHFNLREKSSSESWLPAAGDMGRIHE